MPCKRKAWLLLWKTNQSRIEFFLKCLCSERSSIFTWEHEILFPRSDPKKLPGCCSMDVWQALQEVQPHRWVDLCCEGNTDHPQTRGNAAALVMPQLLISDHKSQEDHCYIWQPGWREWQDCTDCTPWISSSLQPNMGIAWSNSPKQSQR